MRGADTNVLVRYLTRDHPEQFEAAASFLESSEEAEERVFLNVIVLCELCWVLRGPRYGYDRVEIAEVLTRLLRSRVFEIERRDLVRAAVEGFRSGRGDFSDQLIGRINRSEGCEETVSLDAALAGVDEFRVLGSD